MARRHRKVQDSFYDPLPPYDRTKLVKNYEPWQELAASVVYTALCDYQKTKDSDLRAAAALRRWLHSDWCSVLAPGLDMDMIIESINTGNRRLIPGSCRNTWNY